MNVEEHISIVLSTEEVIYLRGFIKHQLRKLSQCEERDQIEKFYHRLEEELLRSRYQPKEQVF